MHRPRFYDMLGVGLLLFGFTLPLSKSAGNILLFLIYPVVAAGIWRYKDVRESIVSHLKQPLTVAFALYMAIALVGIFFTANYEDGYFVARKFVSLPAIYLLFAVLIDRIPDAEARYRQAELVLLVFLAGLTVLNCIGLMTYFGVIGHKKFVLPLTPMNVHHIWFSNINALGIYAAVSFLLFSERGRSTGGRAFFFGSISLAVICVILSMSRAAWFGIALTSLIMAFLVSKKKRAFFLLSLSIAVVCGILYLSIPIIHDRISLIMQDIMQYSAGEQETSLGSRFLMWKAAFEMFLSHPLVGVGTGGYFPMMAENVKTGMSPDFLLAYNQPHNMYLFALATNGIFGLAALLYVFYRIFKLTLPFKPGNNTTMLFAFLAVAAAVHFMLAGLTDSFFNIQILRYAFVFVMGVSMRSSLIAEEKKVMKS